MLIGLLLLAGSALLLVAGAELFVESMAGAARRLGLTVVAVGLLLAGAEPEELITAAWASASGHPGLAAGDAIGANITMLTVTIGLAAVVAALPVGRRVRRYAIGAAVAGGLAVAVLLDGAVSRLEGVALLVAYALGVAVIWRVEKAPPAIGELAEAGDGEAEDADDGHGLPGLLAGLVLMASGGVVAVAGATRVVAALGRGDDAVGLTLLALATTAELFALVAAAARRGATEVAVAGIVGSAAYNATATLGVAALVRPLAGVHIVAPAIAAAVLPLLVVVLALRRGRLPRSAGVVLVAGYLLFAGYTLR